MLYSAKVHVTVVIPTFNGEKYIVETIASVLNQTHEDLDVLVVDDGSTDSTRDAVRSVSDPRLRIVEQANSGVAAARNRGLAEASGDVIAFLDQDDIWFADKLHCQLPLLADPGVGIVGALMAYLGDGGRRLGTAGEIASAAANRRGPPHAFPSLLDDCPKACASRDRRFR
jgi:glycosyltransferase involved in cell wall biosynthesis